jgi:lysophospholipase L1-like esterase
MKNKLNGVIPKSVQAGLWAVGLLLLAEGGVRSRAWYRHGDHGPVADIYQLDQAGHRRLKPGAVLAGSRRNVQINRLGFRGQEPQIPKPEGLLRMVALGDSTTFGMEAGDDDAVWVSRLVTELTRSSSRQFDAINGGVPGYTLADSITLLHDRIVPLEPDIIIVNQVATDIAAHARRQFGSSARQSDSAAPLSAFFEERSLLLNLLKVNSTPLTARWLSPRRHDSLDEGGVTQYEQQLTALVEECRRREWRAVLCTAPRSFGDSSAPSNQFELAASSLANNPALTLAGLNAAFDRYNAAVREVAQRTDTPLIDLDRDVPRRADYFADAVHLNDAGHKLVGRVVAREIRKLVDNQAVARSTP